MTCSICDKPGIARGWCNAHYKRWRKYGDPTKLSSRPRKTHCINGHRFDKKNTYHRKDGKRTCRTCARYFARAFHKRETAAGRKFPQASKEWKAQYHAEVKAGLRTPKRKPRPKTALALLDLLEIEGDWWTIDALAHRLKAKPNTIRMALRRSPSVEARERFGLVEWKYLTSTEESV